MRQRKEKSMILLDNPDKSSLASLILLNRFLRIKDSGKQISSKKRTWLTFRNKFFRRLKKKRKTLECFYCKKTNLTANFNNPNLNNYDGKATVDHFIPTSKCGEKWNEQNLVCSCSDCNSLKKDLDYKSFYIKFYKKITFNQKFIKYATN